MAIPDLSYPTTLGRRQTVLTAAHHQTHASLSLERLAEHGSSSTQQTGSSPPIFAETRLLTPCRRNELVFKACRSHGAPPPALPCFPVCAPVAPSGSCVLMSIYILKNYFPAARTTKPKSGHPQKLYSAVGDLACVLTALFNLPTPPMITGSKHVFLKFHDDATQTVGGVMDVHEYPSSLTVLEFDGSKINDGYIMGRGRRTKRPVVRKTNPGGKS